jgi:hypothetical protein
MTNIQLLTGIFLLSFLSATKSTRPGKEKSSIPESEGQSAGDELLWPHSGTGGLLEEMLGTNRPPLELYESGLRQNQQQQPYNHIVHGGPSGSTAPSNLLQPQPTIGQDWHNFEQSIDDGNYDILGVPQSQFHKQEKAIAGKRTAYEFEEEQQPGIWGEGIGQHGGNEAATFGDYPFPSYIEVPHYDQMMPTAGKFRFPMYKKSTAVLNQSPNKHWEIHKFSYFPICVEKS